MTIATSNIGINAIWSEANAGGIGSSVAAGDLFRRSYFEGPNGNNTISYNGWGQYGNTSGANRIYGLSAANTDLNFGAYSGLTYYYDNSSFKVGIRVRNTLQAPPFPPFPPTPPTSNDVVVTLNLYDSSGTYQYMTSNTINANATPGGFDQTTTISSSVNPMIDIAYWSLSISTQGFFPGGNKTASLDINGSSFVSGGGNLNANTTNTYTSGTYGTATFASTGQGYDGFYFDIQVF